MTALRAISPCRSPNAEAPVYPRVVRAPSNETLANMDRRRCIMAGPSLAQLMLLMTGAEVERFIALGGMSAEGRRELLVHDLWAEGGMDRPVSLDELRKEL